jgi:hypothetical protein
VVLASGNDASADDLARAATLVAELSSDFPTADVFADVAGGAVHDAGASLSLVGGGRPPRHANLESTMLQAIPARYRCVRLFADASAPARTTIEAAAAQRWNELGGR